MNRRTLASQARHVVVSVSVIAAFLVATPVASFGAVGDISFDFVAASSNPGEAAGSHLITVRLNVEGGGVTDGIATIDAIAQGTSTAADPADYSATTSFTVTFASGAADLDTMDVSIDIVDDAIDEDPDEFIDFLLTNATYGGTGAINPGTQTTHTATIADNDNAPTLSIDDVVVSETAGTASFTITRTGETAQAVTVDAATSDVTATAGQDYTDTSQVGISIAAGGATNTASFDVPITNDTVDEPQQNFTVTLSNPGFASISDATGDGAINDNDPAASLAIDDLSINEGNGGTTNFTFTITRTGETEFTTTFDAATSDGSATTADSDYLANSQVGLSIAPGGATNTTTFTVLVNGDTTTESDEDFTVTISNPGNSTISDPTGTGTIQNDEALPTLSIDDVAVDESAGTATFTITRTGSTSQTVTFDAATSDGTATAGQDYTNTSQVGLSIASGGATNTTTFDVPITEDSVDEPQQSYTVTISNPGNATISDATGTGDINDNDPAPSLSIDDVSQLETNSGTTNFVFTVTRTGETEFAVTFDAATSDGSATTADSDYVANSQVGLSIAAGGATNTTTFTVVVNGDTADEPDEDFTVTISNPGNATISDATGTGTIQNDDAEPVLTIDDPIVDEDAGTATFTITRTGATGQTVTFDIATSDGTASAGLDYTDTSQVGLSIGPGGASNTTTFDVPIVDNATFEATEAFTVTISNPSNATIADPTGDGTINDEDTAPTLSIDDVVVAENAGSATFTITRTGLTDVAATFDAATADGSAIAPGDYTNTSSVGLSIAPGGATNTTTFVVPIVDDELDETPDPETYTVGLSNPGSATISDGTGDGSIADDDSSPVGTPDVYNISEGDTLVTTSFTGVRQNDTDGDDATIALSIALDTSPTNHVGTFTLSADGSFTYTHDGSDGTVDSFTYMVSDPGGNSDGPITVTINIANANPVVTAGATDPDLNEGETFSLDSTTFADGGVLDTHTATVDWGDGSPVEACDGSPTTCDLTQGAGSGSVSGTHDYLNNGVFMVTVNVTDDEAGVGFDTLTATVSNGDLTVNVTGDTTGAEGTDTLAISATYADSGVNDAHTAVIDWGDGTVDDCATTACAIVENGDGTGTVTGSHIYPDDGPFTVVVTVTDDSSDVGSGGLPVTISNIDPIVTLNGLPGGKKEGKTVTVDASVVDPGAEVFSFAWLVLKDGATFKTGAGVNFNFTPDDNGVYDVSVTVDDGDGGADIDSGSLTASNVDPSVTLERNGTPLADIENLGEEGDEITITAVVDDPGSADTHTFDWSLIFFGVEIATGDQATFTFVAPDDGTYFVSVDVDDDDNPGDTGTGIGALLGIFDNAIPTIDFVDGDGTPAAGSSASLSVEFSDAGVNDVLDVTIDWGDSTIDTFSAATSPVVGSHVYATPGPRTVETCVSDDDGASSCESFQVLVGGSASLGADFDNDGREDLAIGIPGEDAGAGAVSVVYGRAAGPATTGNQFIQQGSGAPGAAESGDAFGSALAQGDFNADGYADLAIGAPSERIAGVTATGNVTVLYGSASGLTNSGSQVWHQDTQFILGTNGINDQFGYSLAAGDFNGDGYVDLAVGIPGEVVNSKSGAGRIDVIYGSDSGLSAAGDQTLHENFGEIPGNAQTDDGFGSSLAAGDFDGDEKWDLAIGIPGQQVGGFADAGAIVVLEGTLLGLTTEGSDLWHQNSLKNAAEKFDAFGSSLASGDFDNDGRDDLAIGVPNEGLGGVKKSGAVAVMYGSSSGLAKNGNQLWHENSAGIEAVPEKADLFGTAVAAGDFDGDGNDDLAIGVPKQDVAGVNNGGEITILYGTSIGITATGDQRWSRETPGVAGSVKGGAKMGSSLVAGDHNGDGSHDLAIGIPDQKVSGAVHAGAVLWMPGSAGGITEVGDKDFTQAKSGMLDAPEAEDTFGATL